MYPGWSAKTADQRLDFYLGDFHVRMTAASTRTPKSRRCLCCRRRCVRICPCLSSPVSQYIHIQREGRPHVHATRARKNRLSPLHAPDVSLYAPLTFFAFLTNFSQASHATPTCSIQQVLLSSLGGKIKMRFTGKRRNMMDIALSDIPRPGAGGDYFTSICRGTWVFLSPQPIQDHAINPPVASPVPSIQKQGKRRHYSCSERGGASSIARRNTEATAPFPYGHPSPPIR